MRFNITILSFLLLVGGALALPIKLYDSSASSGPSCGDLNDCADPSNVVSTALLIHEGSTFELYRRGDPPESTAYEQAAQVHKLAMKQSKSLQHDYEALAEKQTHQYEHNQYAGKAYYYGAMAGRHAGMAKEAESLAKSSKSNAKSNSPEAKTALNNQATAWKAQGEASLQQYAEEREHFRARPETPNDKASAWKAQRPVKSDKYTKSSNQFEVKPKPSRMAKIKSFFSSKSKSKST